MKTHWTLTEPQPTHIASLCVVKLWNCMASEHSTKFTEYNSSANDSNVHHHDSDIRMCLTRAFFQFPYWPHAIKLNSRDKTWKKLMSVALQSHQFNLNHMPASNAQHNTTQLIASHSFAHVSLIQWLSVLKHQILRAYYVLTKANDEFVKNKIYTKKHWIFHFEFHLPLAKSTSKLIENDNRIDEWCFRYSLNGGKRFVQFGGGVCVLWCACICVSRSNRRIVWWPWFVRDKRDRRRKLNVNCSAH